MPDERYFAPPSPAARANVKKARLGVKHARARLLIAKKCKKYGTRRLNETKKLARASRTKWRKFKRFLKRDFGAIVLGASIEVINKKLQHLNAMAADLPTQAHDDIPTGHDIYRDILQLGYDVASAKDRLARARGVVNDAMEARQKSVCINTTIQNAESVQVVANYFEAQDAGRVFVDAVRPWLTAAIYQSRELMEKSTGWQPQFERCLQCRVVISSRGRWESKKCFCPHCGIRLCTECLEDDHWCPVVLDIAEKRTTHARKVVARMSAIRAQPRTCRGALQFRPNPVCVSDNDESGDDSLSADSSIEELLDDDGDSSYNSD